MPNENEEVLDLTPEVAEEATEGEEDNTDWKALAQRNAGIAKRNATRLAKMKESAKTKAETPAPTEIKNKNGFGYDEMAYLEAKGVSDDDYPIVLAAINATGKSLRDVLNSKYVQSEIKEAKEVRSSKDAIPTGSKRSSPAPRDTVEYHLANKTPLSKIEDQDLRRKVVEAKIKADTSGNKFTRNSVV